MRSTKGERVRGRVEREERKVEERRNERGGIGETKVKVDRNNSFEFMMKGE